MWRNSSPRKGLINGRTGRSTGRRSGSAGTRYELARPMQPATCNPMSQPGTGSAMETTRSRSFMSTSAEQGRDLTPLLLLRRIDLMPEQEVDEYLANLDEPKRTTPKELRQTIRSIVPEAEEGISYGMPAYRLLEAG